MTLERIPTELWIKAHVKHCTTKGIPIFVIRRGDPHSGTVILKLNQLEAGNQVFSQIRDENGNLGWLPQIDGRLMSENEANTLLERQIQRDPDLWIIEIEDRKGRHWVDGPLI